MYTYKVRRFWQDKCAEIATYFRTAQVGTVSLVPIVFLPHFAERVVERVAIRDRHIVRRMLYKLCNSHLVEFLYWFYSDVPLDCLITSGNICVVIGRRGSSAAVRTCYLNNNPKLERFFHIPTEIEKVC